MSLVELVLILSVARISLSYARATDKSIPPLDVFITKEESQRLLDTAAEIHYVQKGEKKEYSLQFELLVKPHIQNVSFFWTTNGPTDLTYSIHVSPQSSESMPKTTLSIPNNGFVPSDRQEFSVVFPCNDKVSQETHVVIAININGPTLEHPYQLDIRRRRICKALNPPVTPLPTLSTTTPEDPWNRILGNFTVDPTRHPVSLGWIITATVILVVLIIAIGAVVCIVRRSKKEVALPPDPRDYLDALQTSSYPFEEEAHEASEAHASTVAAAESRYAASRCYEYDTSTSILPVPPPSLLSQNTCRRQFDIECIDEGEVLASGNFGLIKRGYYVSEDDNRQEEILIKTLRNGMSPVHLESAVRSLLKLANLLCGFEHENVCGAIGTVVNLEIPMVIYASSRQAVYLKEFLVSPRKDRDLALTDMLDLDVQALRGLRFLHERGVVHRDVAARNCLLSENDHRRTLQITDSALARDIYPSDYLCLADEKNRPVKWMAIESLTDNEYSSASDVWSFGVLMWEIHSLGAMPFEDYDGFEIARLLQTGHRVVKPSVTFPDELWLVQTRCWVLSPIDRPKVDYLLRRLTEFHETIKRNYV